MSNKGDKEQTSDIFSWQMMVMSDVKTSDIRCWHTWHLGHQILAAGQVTTESPEEILVVLAPYRWSSACKLGKHLL